MIVHLLNPDEPANLLLRLRELAEQGGAQGSAGNAEGIHHDADASFILQELHLYHWGAFAGRHQVAIDPGNSAIIGPTGSGKTTLVDALMTLLCASPRYNLALDWRARERPRSGELCCAVPAARATTAATTLHAPGAAPQAWPPGWCARVQRAKRRCGWARCCGLTAAASRPATCKSAGSLRKARSTALDLWLEEQHSGGAKALTRLAKDSDGLQMFSSKAPYLAKLHSFLKWPQRLHRCSTGRRASSSSTASTKFSASWCWTTTRAL